ncbi:uncharacterized protein LOC143876011 [Tasmannia lanceolata]|uniref:uncharacterized protein LOC143876011 n=1 Tax=Tasmannia lanceolata TaxID=3420 RepID=UPI00406388B1
MAVLRVGDLPLGFRFHPTDEEIINHYLMRKIEGRKSEVEVIAEVDVCKCEPWDLPDKSLIRTDDPEWFFFSPLDRKYPTGHRSNRATEAGYWKATGKDRLIKSRSHGLGLIGTKKTLVFYKGRAPKGKRTCWIMHEYRPTENMLAGVNDGGQGAYVICRLFKKADENIVNSKCDEIDAKNGDSNFDTIEPSGLSPTTTTKSSPEETQHAGDAFLPFETTLNEGIPVLDTQEQPQHLAESIEKKPVNIERWLADNGTFDMEDHVADVVAREVVFYEPVCEPLDVQGFSDAYGSRIPSCNSPFYDYSVKGQQIGICEDGRVDQDTSSIQSITEFLDGVFNNEIDDYSSFEDSTCPNDLAVNTKSEAVVNGQQDQIFGDYNICMLNIMSSISSGDTDAELLVAQGDDTAEPEVSSVESAKAYKVVAHEPVNLTELENSSTDSAADSHNFEEPTSWKNMSHSRGDRNGAVFELRGPQSQDLASSYKPVAQASVNVVQPFVPEIEDQACRWLYESAYFNRPYENIGPLNDDCAEAEVSSDYSSPDSLQDLFNDIRDPIILENLTSSGADLDGTGIKIRGRQPQDLGNSHKIVAHAQGQDMANTHKFVAQSQGLANSSELNAQGLAIRRIHLQKVLNGSRKMWMEPVFGNGNESNSDGVDNETKSVITEATQNVEDTASTGTVSSGSVHIDKLEDHGLILKAAESHSASSSSVLPIADKSSPNKSCLDSDSNEEITQESNLRLRVKQSIDIGKIDYNPEGSAQLEASSSTFSLTYAALVIIFVLLFGWVWKCFEY